MKTFISQVVKSILATNLKLENQIIILPSRRAGVFFKDELIRQLGASSWAPKIWTIEDLVTDISSLKIVDSISLTCYFYDVYIEQGKGKKIDTFDKFAKWANIALYDFNEIDRYLIDTDKFFANFRDIKKMEAWTLEEPTPLMSKFLSFWDNMEVYYKKLRDKLSENGMAYQGMAFRTASENIQQYIDITDVKDEFHIVGFNAINKAEETIINTLLNNNKARVYWDADKYYFENDMQEAGIFLRNHRKKWKYFNNNNFNWVQDNFEKKKNIKIIGVPKMVGQAKVAGQILTELNQNEKMKFHSTAIVLANENLLLPTLNSLPEEVKNINITMGYPIKNTPIAGFFELVFMLQDKVVELDRMNSEKPFYYKNLIHILKHPMLKNYLGLKNKSSEKIIGKIKKENHVFIGLDSFSELKNDTLFSSIMSIWNNDAYIAIEQCVSIISSLKTFYNENPSDNTLELEYLFRFSQIFNQLQNFQKKFPYFNELKTLSSFFSQILSAETVSFRGEPLLGLQLMGVLETRLLDFENIIITSVNEGVLPAGISQNSFIPYDLKIEMGLPSYKEKDAIYAYHFYRLIQRAKKIYILYNTEPDDVGANEKSRFLTQLIHEATENINIEQYIFSAKTNFISQKSTSVYKNKSVMKKIHMLGDKGFSASAINKYLNNGMDFYYEKILGVKKDDDVEETMAINTLGSIVHEVLEDLYTPFLNKSLSKEDINSMKNNIDTSIRHKFDVFTHSDSDISGKNLLIFNVAKEFIHAFMRNEMELVKKGSKLKVLAVEEKVSADIFIKKLNKSVKVFGIIDRIDILDGVLRVLDYKTGNVEAKELKISSFDDIIEEKAMPKALQVMYYGMMFFKNLQVNKREFHKIITGVIAMKKMKNNTYILSESNKENIEVNKETVDEFQEIISNIITEIFDENIAFQETLNE